MKAMIIGDDLSPNTKLYRYITIESFLALVETGLIPFTNVNKWDDKWEVILSKIPTVDEDNKPKAPLYSFYQYIFGQCWSLREESDAMWRIYSPAKTGIRIATSIEKFNLLSEVSRLHIEKVIYFDSVADLLAKASSHTSPFKDALFKRSVFDHECEVRVLTHGDFIDHFEPGWSHVSLPIDIRQFIKGITVDPRADDWFINTIQGYCKRTGLDVQPIKSNLYESDPHLKIGIVKKWIEMHNE